MEELREQIKRKLRILSESNIAYYDLFPLLVFIAKYFPSISGQKEKISMSVEWYEDEVLILVYAILPEDDDLDSPTPAKESRIYFKVPEEVDLQVGGQLSGLANEETFDSCLDQLFACGIDKLSDFLLDYFPASQLIYICEDENCENYEKIYFTDIDMVILATGSVVCERELII